MLKLMYRYNVFLCAFFPLSMNRLSALLMNFNWFCKILNFSRIVILFNVNILAGKFVLYLCALYISACVKVFYVAVLKRLYQDKLSGLHFKNTPKTHN